MTARAAITITYCPGCRWLARSAWMAQELLESFTDELESVALRPASVSGQFEIRLNEEVIWDRKADGGFPDIRMLKQTVRDRIAPEKSLGHTDSI